MLGIFLLPGIRAGATDAPTGLDRINHVLVLMQENHSFDNYLGTLPYVPGGPYHPPAKPGGPCPANDHQCVDGLTCSRDAQGNLSCANSNPGINARKVSVYHETAYCTANPPHEWFDAHREANFDHPNSSEVLGDGFALVRPSNTTAMGYYSLDELPFYYALAETFALSDAHFSALIGPTMPNRSYLMAATSFGHVLTSPVDNTPSSRSGYRPLTGSIFDLLDRHRVSWIEYYELPSDHMTPPRPYGRLFREPSLPNFKLIGDFFGDARAGELPQVAFISLVQHEHPPLDIRAGEHAVAKIAAAVRASPNWKDTILFLTYDENGGFYDHVRPPAAPSPDGIPPGRCADLSNPPASRTPGNGAHCELSLVAQRELCPAADDHCADFTLMGFRDPLIVVAPFARPHYVSHAPNDQTSIVALIEKRFLANEHLTARDAAADSIEDLFDFANAPSRDAPVAATLAPAPRSDDPGCARR
jgi:phospholipase C